MTTSLSETMAKQKRPISFSGMNVRQVKSELTAQLNDKEKLLGKSGTSQISRNALIKQTDVIKKEILDLNQYEQEDELPDEIRSKLEGLANEVQFLKSSKVQIRLNFLEKEKKKGMFDLIFPFSQLVYKIII